MCVYRVPDLVKDPSARAALRASGCAHTEIATAMNDAQQRCLGTLRQRRQHLRFVEQRINGRLNRADIAVYR